MIPNLRSTAGQFSIALPEWQGRKITVFTSTNLIRPEPWDLWLVPGNAGIPPLPGQSNKVIGPMDAPQRFFKIRVEQQ